MRRRTLRRYADGCAPSLATLKSAFPGAEPSTLRTVRDVLRGVQTPRDASPACDRWVRGCFNEPSHHEQVLWALDDLLQGHGVEALHPRDSDDTVTDCGVRFCPRFSYANMGDTYTCTILRDHTEGAWIVASWGDVIEEFERVNALRFPSVRDVAREVADINRNVEGECAVRLQVWDDGQWRVRYGDSQYDTDHRGYWGASSVPGVNGGRVTRCNSREVAKDLIEQAREMHAQGEGFR